MLTQSEIKRSHAEGFGGSDAKMFRRIADGKTLTYSDRVRIRIALGIDEDRREDFATPATRKGHDFESFAGAIIRQRPDARNASAEYLLEAKMAKNFRTFAHADYFDPTTGTVIECKCTDDEDIEDVKDFYIAQLQWYYLMPAVRKVVLCWHDSGWFDFSAENTHFLEIDKDADYCADLTTAVEALDERADDYRHEEGGIITTANASPEVAEAVETLECAMVQIKAVEKTAAEAKARLLAAMEAAGVLRLEWPVVSVTYVAATTAKTFDKKALSKAHPEIDLTQFEKETPRAASLRITIKEA